jgi:rhamnosyltransferase
MSNQVVNLPKVLILMACYNAMRYIDEQIQSIAAQTGCSINLLISIDKSTDNTYAHIQNLQTTYPFITLLTEGKCFGSAAANFYHLIQQANIEDVDFVAFCDQDDNWHSDKLSRHIAIAKEYHADGVSSNVTAFWPNGEQQLIDKSQSQRQYDYLFESAGPGCTFLMTPWLIRQLKTLLQADNSLAQSVTLHDWLAYAVCRANHKTWIIDSAPSLQYRQHADNVVGANKGLKAFKVRLANLKNGWYRQEVLKITSICNAIQPTNVQSQLIFLLKNKRLSSRLYLIYMCGYFRRKLIDRLFLMVCILTGLF